MCPLFQYRAELSSCPEHPLCAASASLSAPGFLATTDLPTAAIVPPPPGCRVVETLQCVWPVETGFDSSNGRVRSLHVFMAARLISSSDDGHCSVRHHSLLIQAPEENFLGASKFWQL